MNNIFLVLFFSKLFLPSSFNTDLIGSIYWILSRPYYWRILIIWFKVCLHHIKFTFIITIYIFILIFLLIDIFLLYLPIIQPWYHQGRIFFGRVLELMTFSGLWKKEIIYVPIYVPMFHGVLGLFFQVVVHL